MDDKIDYLSDETIEETQSYLQRMFGYIKTPKVNGLEGRNEQYAMTYEEIAIQLAKDEGTEPVSTARIQQIFNGAIKKLQARAAAGYFNHL